MCAYANFKQIFLPNFLQNDKKRIFYIVMMSKFAVELKPYSLPNNSSNLAFFKCKSRWIMLEISTQVQKPKFCQKTKWLHYKCWKHKADALSGNLKNEKFYSKLVCTPKAQIIALYWKFWKCYSQYSPKSAKIDERQGKIRLSLDELLYFSKIKFWALIFYNTWKKCSWTKFPLYIMGTCEPRTN